MPNERDKAKQGIVRRSVPQQPAKLNETLRKANALELETEKHGHLERMQAANLGVFGKVLGGERNAAIVIAFIVILIAMFSAVGLWIAAAHSARPEFWSHEAGVALSFAGAALSFIFGRTTGHTHK